MTQASALAPYRNYVVTKPWVSAETLLARARELTPYVREQSDNINAARRIPDEVMERLADAGLTQILRPQRFGGPGAPMNLMFRIAQQLALGDGSLAWVYVVLGSHDQFLAFYPKDVQEEVWASARPMCASSYNPTGKAIAASGGFNLSGKWSFCSGIDFCDWIVLGAIVGMLPGEKPVPDMRYCLVHKSQFKIIDDWHVMGLCGTGSKSVILDNAFVPDERIFSGAQLGSGQTPGVGVHDGPTYRAPGFSAFVFGFPAVATGIVRSAYETLKLDFQGRASRREPMFELGKAAVQIHLTEASVLLDISDLLFDRAIDETFAQIHKEGTVSMSLRIRNRRDLNYLVINSRRAAEILMGMSGGRGILEGGRVQRALRDIYGLSAHPSLNWDIQSLSYGAVELGGQPTDPIL